MLATPFESNLSICHTYSITRGIHDRWPRQHAPVADTEMRAVPGTFNDISGQCALIQRPTGMWAGCGNSRKLVAPPQQNHRNTGHHYPVQFALLYLSNW